MNAIARKPRRTTPSQFACPACGGTVVAVSDSRPNTKHSVIRRRRFCETCRHRWTTSERTVRSGKRPDPLGGNGVWRTIAKLREAAAALEAMAPAPDYQI